METLAAPDATEMIIGALLIAFHAYGRYNTPESNRSSTTMARFLACWLLYATSLIVVYWLITVLAWVSPEIVLKLLQSTLAKSEPGDVANLLRSPITTALLFTSLLPNFPLLRKLDRRLLQFFWDLGEIPGHAVKLAHRMYRARFNIHPARLPELERNAKKYDIDAGLLDLRERRSPILTWAMSCSLILEMEQWSSGKNPHYKRFIENRASEFEDIKAEYVTFSTRVSSYYRRLGDLEASTSAIREDLREELIADGRQRLMRVCKLLAHAVLSVEVGIAARTRALEGLGFELSLESKENLSAVQLLQLLGLVMTAFLAISAVSYSNEEGALDWSALGDIVFFAFLMSINYGISAFFGIYPKTRWRFADIEVTGSRPWLGYLCSGVIAVAASLFMIAALRFTRYNFAGLDYDDSFDKLLVHFSWSYPYLLLSFVIGFGVALTTDNGHDRSSGSSARRVDLLVMGAGVAVAAVVAYAAMHGLLFFEGTKSPEYRNTEHGELVYFTMEHLMIGVLIGLLVPQWYRKNRYRSPVQRVVRFINRNGHALRVEAGRLQPGELKEALVVSTAAITLANGTVDDMEKDVIRRCLVELAEQDMLDFGVETAMQESMEQIQKWQEDHRETHQLTMDAATPLRGRPLLSELLVRICAAVGYADGVFERFEQDVLEELIRILRLDEQKCLASCGLGTVINARRTAVPTA